MCPTTIIHLDNTNSSDNNYRIKIYHLIIYIYSKTRDLQLDGQ